MDNDSIVHPVVQPIGGTTEPLPPLSNRGVTEQTEFKQSGRYISLDWLRYSVPWPNEEIPQDSDRGVTLRRAFHPSDKLHFTGELLPTPKGYDTCLALNAGSVRYHSALPGQKIGVEFTGRDLARLRELDLTALDMLDYALQAGGRVTRLDLAIDVFGIDADPADVHRAFLAGEVNTPAQTVSQVEQKRRFDGRLVSDGITVYVGSRASDRFLRVYDKAREQNLDSVKWTRIECVLGGDRAAALAAILSIGFDIGLLQAVIRQYCTVPTVPWYSDAVAGEIYALPVLPRKDSNRKLWLLKQVLPALKAELLECRQANDRELYEAFSRVLEESESAS